MHSLILPDIRWYLHTRIFCNNGDTMVRMLDIRYSQKVVSSTPGRVSSEIQMDGRMSANNQTILVHN